jgi:ABC-type Fe3+/spermidine/putrescine transport system ATPase subunit
MSLHVDVELFVGTQPRLRAIFSAARGDVVLIVGPNGSGKTTLLRALLGLVAPTRGEVRRYDEKWSSGPEILVPSEARGFGYVPQAPTLFAERSVGQNVALGGVCRDLSAKKGATAAREYIEAFDLVALKNRKAADLSGGEAARTSLARAFASCPRHLALDEPLAHLSEDSRRSVVDAVARGLGALEGPHLIVTHHPAWFSQVNPRVLRVQKHALIED